MSAMDKLTLTSAVLFGAAEVMVLSAVLMPDWIVTNVGGPARLGLLRTCVTLHGRGGQERCGTPDSLPPEWLLALILSLGAAVAVLVALVLTLVSAWDRDLVKYAQWSGFAASEEAGASTPSYNFKNATLVQLLQWNFDLLLSWGSFTKSKVILG